MQKSLLSAALFVSVFTTPLAKAADAPKAADRPAVSTEKRLADLEARLEQMLAKRGLKLDVTKAAKAQIAALGYDPAFGARPLKRAIQREIQNPLALAVLEGKFNDGDVITADVEGDGLVFRKAAG